MSNQKDVQTPKPLQLRHIFGLRSDVSSPFHFLDENNVIFTAGHHLVCHNIEDKTQSFVQGQNHGSTLPSNGITAIDVFVPKKLIAIAERTDKCATIQIFELSSDKKRRRKVITCTDIQSREIVSLKFSNDSKFLLAIGGAPDWSIINYQREKGRIVQIIKNQTISTMPFYSGSYCPSDTNLMVCTGHKVLKFYKTEQSELKQIAISLGKREPQDYTAHCWDQDKRLLVATEHAEILIFDGTEFRGVFDTQFSAPIFSILSFSKGFICGCDNGTMLVFERGDDKEMYKKINKLSILNENNSITHLCIPPSEEQLACIVGNNQVYALNLSQIEVLKQENENEVQSEEDRNFTPLLTLFHYKGITGLDMCIRKPYLVTSGYDRTVKVWNWHEKKMIINKQFNEDPLCVAMHPSGLHIVVGFADKLRIMNILMDDIRGFKDFSIKGCTEVKFSNGGQYFAAINASAVQIYESYTFNNIATLRGHTAKVTSLWWCPDDSQLVTSSTDNSVLVWNIHSNSRTQEHQDKGCSYTSAVLDNKNLLFVAGSDDTLKIISEGKLKRAIDLPLCITSLELTKTPQNWLFAATNSGMLISVKIASLIKQSSDPQMIDVQAHTQPITRMRVSHDDTMVATTSQDGCICIFDVVNDSIISLTSSTEKGGVSSAVASGGVSGSGGSKKKELQQLSWAEEILVTRSDLEERLLEIEKLKKKVEDLRLHNEFEIRMKEMNYQEKLKEVNDKFQLELDQDKNKYNALRSERDEMQNKYEDTLKSLAQKHEENLFEVENYHKQKIKSEKQRFTDLKLRLETLGNQWEEDKARRDEKYNKELNDLQSEYESKIADEKDDITQISLKIQKLRKEFEEIKVLLEEDADQEIAEMKSKYDKVLKTDRTQTLELRGNNGMLKREFAGLQQRIKNGNDKMQKSLEEQNKLIEEIRRFEKDIDGYEREIGERDSTIKEKNKMISEVQKKNQELEKFKFVLDYKIHELDRQIKPREAKIQEINKQIKEMKSEVDSYLLHNRILSLSVKDLKLKLKGLQNEQDAQTEVNDSMGNLIKVIGHELTLLHKNSADDNKLKNGIIRLHEQFREFDLSQPIDPEGNDSGKGGGNKKTIKQDASLGIHEEFQRHRNYLERTVQGLQKKLVKDSTVFKKDSTRIMQENVALIKEINELRREISVAQKIKRESKSNTSNASQLRKQVKENQREIEELMQLKEQLEAIDNR